MAKISGFIVGILLIGGIMAILGIVLSDFGTHYSVTYDESQLSAYNKMTDISTQTQTLRNQTLGLAEKPNALDVVGSFFSQGYTAFKITAQSFDLFSDIADSAAEDTNLGNAGYIIKSMLVLIVLVIIIVGIFISAILKKDV